MSRFFFACALISSPLMIIPLCTASAVFLVHIKRTLPSAVSGSGSKVSPNASSMYLLMSSVFTYLGMVMSMVSWKPLAVPVATSRARP